MKKIRLRKSAIFCLLIAPLFFGAGSCSDEKPSSEKELTSKKEKKRNRNKKNIAELVYPKNRVKLQEGDALPVLLELKDSTLTIDSVRFFVDGEWILTKAESPFEFEWDSKGAKMGKHNFIAVVHKSDSTREGHNARIEIFPSEVPKNYVYQVVNDYHHDPKAFTQGFLYDNGYLLEGTGHKGTSSLRKVEIRTGEVVKMVSLPDKYFGEGIALFKDEIFQITWKSQAGFVYDRNTFEKKREFKYPSEGWGLTTMGDQLIMSDGSNVLYFLDPNSFTELSRIEVYDDKGPVKKLNELEFIEAEIWANVWETNYLVRVDPKTGKVFGKIDLTGILDRRRYTGEIDVLNGIAYDPVMKRVFVTGKNWPRLFEIKIIEKK